MEDRHEGLTSKVRQVVAKLRQMAGEAGDGARLPGFRDLMKMFDVSQATISSALDVLASEGLVERRPGSGIYVCVARPYKPFLVLADASWTISPSPFWEMVFEGLCQPFGQKPQMLEAVHLGGSLVPLQDRPAETALPRSLMADLKSGAFAGAFCLSLDDRIPWMIEDLGIPVVSFSCPSHYMVQLANLEACQIGTSELIKAGCHRIALYNAPYIGTKEVFTAALTAHGAKEVVVPPSVGFTQRPPKMGRRSRLIEAGFNEGLRLFSPESTETRPDGIFCVDDMFTMGFVMALQRLGLQAGKDVHIATHINHGSPVLAAWQHQLIALEFDIRQIGQSMITGMSQIIKGEQPGRGGWEHSVVMEKQRGLVRVMLVRPKLLPPTDEAPTPVKF